MNLPSDQGRARGLYDEQLQRLQQEQLLLKGAPAAAAAESDRRVTADERRAEATSA